MECIRRRRRSQASTPHSHTTYKETVIDRICTLEQCFLKYEQMAERYPKDRTQQMYKARECAREILALYTLIMKNITVDDEVDYTAQYLAIKHQIVNEIDSKLLLPP